jgi:hypothetical protein
LLVVARRGQKPVAGEVNRQKLLDAANGPDDAYWLRDERCDTGMKQVG